MMDLLLQLAAVLSCYRMSKMTKKEKASGKSYSF